MLLLSGYWRRCYFSLQIDLPLVRLLRLVCNRVEIIAIPHPTSMLFYAFPDLPKASALSVTTSCIVAMS